MKVKLFYDSNFNAIETRINKFIAESHDCIKIEYICQSQSLDEEQGEFLTISIWYEEIQK